MPNHRAMLSGLVMLALVLAQGLAGGQDLPDRKTATTTKVGVVLSVLHEEYTSHQRLGDGTDFESENPLIRIVEDRVVIDAVASGDTAALRADLEALGMQHAASFGRMVSGQLPVRAIADADALDSLQFADPPVRRRGVPDERGPTSPPTQRPTDRDRTDATKGAVPRAGSDPVLHVGWHRVRPEPRGVRPHSRARQGRGHAQVWLGARRPP